MILEVEKIEEYKLDNAVINISAKIPYISFLRSDGATVTIPISRKSGEKLIEFGFSSGS
jgi:hypothetical protein